MELVTFLIWLLIIVLIAIAPYRILALAPLSPFWRAVIEIVFLLVVIIILIQWAGPPRLPSLWIRYWWWSAACWMLAAGCF